MLKRIQPWFWLAAGLLIGLRVWLTYGSAIDVNTYGTYDDFLFLRLAALIRDGAWLGKLDEITLIKGPFYPLWIALVSRLGISLLLSEQALYCLACAVIAAALRPLFRSRWPLLALLAVLLFVPVTYSYATSLRTLREAVYPALSLLVFACAAGLALRLRPASLATPIDTYLRADPDGDEVIPDPETADGPGFTSPPRPSPSQTRRWRGERRQRQRQAPSPIRVLDELERGLGGEVSHDQPRVDGLKRVSAGRAVPKLAPIGVVGEGSVPWPWSLLLGLSFGACWLTREEGVWLLPAIGLLLLAALLPPPPGHPKGLWRPLGCPGWLPAILLALLSAAILPLIVFSLNNRYYGLFNKTELDDRDFQAAYGALIRVRTGETIARVPVSRKTRRAIYPVSPAFRELKPGLEGELGKVWASFGEQTEESRGEITGGHFIWAFRQAVRASGHYDGMYPRDYYRQLAAEVTAACDSGALVCDPLRASLAPPLRRADLRPILRAAGAAIDELLYLRRFRRLSRGSIGEPSDLEVFSRLTHDPISGDDRYLIVSGAAYSTDREDTTGLQVKITNGHSLLLPGLSPLPIDAILAAEVQNLTSVPAAAFRIRTFSHPTPALEVYDHGRLALTVPLVPNETAGFWEKGSIVLKIDRVATEVVDPSRLRWDAARDRLKIATVSLYRRLTVFAAALAALATAGLTLQMFRRRFPLRAWLVIIATLAAIGTRVALLAVIDATSFSAVAESYLSPAYPLVYVWIVLSLAAAGSALGLQIMEAK